MYNKVNVENPKRKWLKFAAVYLALFAGLSAALLFVFGAVNSRNYNGQVKEVSGVIANVNHSGEDGIEVKMANGKVYNANPVINFDKNLDLDALVGKNVTLYVPQSQFGSSLPWIIGIKQGDNTIVDYNDLIAERTAENRLIMTIVGVIAGVFALATVTVYVLRKRVAPTVEKELYKELCEINARRQPSCPEYRKGLTIYVLAYLAYTVFYCAIVAIFGNGEENGTISTVACIAVCVSLGVVFVAATVGLFVTSVWIVKRERKFYAENFPFDFTDLSQVTLRKGIKESLQTELKAERARHPHRYGDGANGYTVEFCDMGLIVLRSDSLNDYNATSYPSSDKVFGVGGAEQYTQQMICMLGYEKLNFEALPYYRKKDRPFAVVIKSRLEKSTELPAGMEHDVHLMLDSNLLATLRQFNVKVENLDYLLENKAQLIAENCPKAKVEVRFK